MEILLERVSSWPEDEQEELVAAAAEIELRRTDVYRLSDDERAAVREGLEQAKRGEFVSDDVVAEFFSRPVK